MGGHTAADVRTNVERTDEGTRGRQAPARILVATDGSDASKLAILKASEYARRFDSKIYLTHITPIASSHCGFGPAWDPDEGDTLTIYEEDVERARGILDEHAKQLADEGVSVEKANLGSGEPAAEVVAFAEEIMADLVVVGSRRTGAFQGAAMGRVSESVLRYAHCPVVVVREQELSDDGSRA
ncbi:MAG: universal stress protein [Rubrobacteraceae bacterium]